MRYKVCLHTYDVAKHWMGLCLLFDRDKIFERLQDINDIGNLTKKNFSSCFDLVTKKVKLSKNNYFAAKKDTKYQHSCDVL